MVLVGNSWEIHMFYNLELDAVNLKHLNSLTKSRRKGHTCAKLKNYIQIRPSWSIYDPFITKKNTICSNVNLSKTLELMVDRL